MKKNSSSHEDNSVMTPHCHGNDKKRRHKINTKQSKKDTTLNPTDRKSQNIF